VNRKDTNFRQPIIKTASSTAGRLRSGILSGAAAIGLAYAALLGSSPASAQQQQRPNILVIFGDDIGQTNISAYSFGVTGYKTPNIDRRPAQRRQAARVARGRPSDPTSWSSGATTSASRT
jgi:alkaline phosphatase